MSKRNRTREQSAADLLHTVAYHVGADSETYKAAKKALDAGHDPREVARELAKMVREAGKDEQAT